MQRAPAHESLGQETFYIASLSGPRALGVLAILAAVVAVVAVVVFAPGAYAAGDHGLVEVRLGEHPRGLLILRDAIEGEVTACGLSISREALALSVVSGGGVTHLQTLTKPKNLPKASQVILISAWTLDRWTTIDVFAGEKHIASFTTDHLACAKGSLKPRLLDAQALSVLSQHARPLCVTPAPALTPHAHRYITLPTPEFLSLSVPLTALGHSPAGVTTLRIDPPTLEALYCTGLSPASISTQTPWKYLDPSYFTASLTPDAPTPLGQLTDHYQNPQMLLASLEALHHQFPDITRLVSVGTSHQGHPILALAIGHHVHSPVGVTSVLFNGAHHGDELLSTLFVLDIAQFLLHNPQNPTVDRWLSQLNIWLIPAVNPDGLYAALDANARAGRKNALHAPLSYPEPHQGVDLNRNYPFRWHALGERGSRSSPIHSRYRGPAPGSEPETQALIKLANTEHFALSISFHTGAIAVLSPYTIDATPNPDPDEAFPIAQEMVARIAPIETGRLFEAKQNLYPVDGTDQDWHRFTHGTLAFLVEAYPYSPPDHATRQAALERLRPAWTYLIDRYLSGPSLHGTVLAPDGTPLQAKITIDEIQTFNGESWTSRCHDGHFDRTLPKSGRYTVRAALGGKTIAKKTVHVGSERVEVHLVAEHLPSGVGAAGCAPQNPPRISARLSHKVVPRALNQAAAFNVATGFALPLPEALYPAPNPAPPPPYKPSEAKESSCSMAARVPSSVGRRWVLLFLGLVCASSPRLLRKKAASRR